MIIVVMSKFAGGQLKALGAVNAIDGAVTFSAKSGSIVVVKIGKESVKVMVDELGRTVYSFKEQLGHFLGCSLFMFFVYIKGIRTRNHRDIFLCPSANQCTCPSGPCPSAPPLLPIQGQKSEIHRATAIRGVLAAIHSIRQSFAL